VYYRKNHRDYPTLSSDEVIPMAKARSRTAARKVKDKWKAKSWYNIVAPPSFDNVTLADTLSDSPDKLLNRVTEVSLQDLTNDFRRSHIKLFFKVNRVEESNAHSAFIGHTLTSDYLRRMIRRKRSKIDGVYDVVTKDGAKVRVKPFATTDKRIQNSQRRVIRQTMKQTLLQKAQARTLSELIKDTIDGKLGSDIYKSCKVLYPVRRVEIYKTEVVSPPTQEMEEEKVIEREKEPEPAETTPPSGEKEQQEETEEPKESPKKTPEEGTPEEPSEEESSEETSETEEEELSEEESEETETPEETPPEKPKKKRK
jgi:small subunit ribosomal protein S3Ae